MNQDIDLVELFAFLLASELERNPTKLMNLFFNIILNLFDTKFSRNIKRQINYGKLLKKYWKIKNFYRQQFFYELENYKNSNCPHITNECSKDIQLKFSFLWSLICNANLREDQKLKALNRLSDLLTEEGYLILTENLLKSQFFHNIHLIQNYCISTGLNLEYDKLEQNFTFVKNVGKGYFGKVRKFKCVKDKKDYAIKTVNLIGKIN
jgi:hypothetical protein